MECLTPRKIAEITGGTLIGQPETLECSVQGAKRDHREIEPGNLFVCIRGERVDGHDFAAQAFESGAACCLCDHAISSGIGPYVLVPNVIPALGAIAKYYRSTFKVPVIGITGSVGKTTAKEMTAAVLGVRFNTLKTKANLNNEIGVPLTLLSLTGSHEAAVIEMGISEFGEMTRLSDIVQPDIALITKIGYSHLETLHDLDGVLRAKSEIFTHMKSGSNVIVCGDDERLRNLKIGFNTITFGLAEHNEYRAENVISDGTDSVMCDIEYPAGKFHAVIPSFGTHLVLSALPAAVIGHLLGMTDHEITRGIDAYSPISGRANVTRLGSITVIDDCYNANPNSVRSALLSLSELTGIKCAILGDMKDLGINSDDLHRDIGITAAHCDIDTLICCGSQAELIYNEFRAENPYASAFCFQSVAELEKNLTGLIPEDCTVLVKASHSMGFERIVNKIAGECRKAVL